MAGKSPILCPRVFDIILSLEEESLVVGFRWNVFSDTSVGDPLRTRDEAALERTD
jgi:hypothetical protein